MHGRLWETMTCAGIIVLLLDKNSTMQAGVPVIMKDSAP